MLTLIIQSREKLKKLLPEDVESRYAVARAIGLEDIRSSLSRIEDAIACLLKHGQRLMQSWRSTMQSSML
ncbi:MULTISPECIES: hypothetical protein [Candidatus Nitrosocaldus]|nr:MULTISPECIES: hypothetical protein [Candidatus Nitrosocaldus]